MASEDMERLRKIIEQEENSRQKIIDKENETLKEKALEDAKDFAKENGLIEKEEKKKKFSAKKNKRKGLGKLSIKVRNCLMGVMLVVLLVLFFIVLFAFPEGKNQGMLVCGDGSFNESCSIEKPYFCENGILVEKASVCGCFEGAVKDGESCVNKKYYNGSGEVVLEYVLNGERHYLTFSYFGGVLDYLEGLPKHLDYSSGEIPRRDDFKFMKIDDEIQRRALMPLVVAIQNAAVGSKDDQARIAVSLVQNLEYGEPEFKPVLEGKFNIRLSSYPYDTVVSYTGSCEGKSELLLFLLRELGFGTSLFYFKDENHEAVGIKCPLENSYYNSGYCFIETTVPSPISFSDGVYLGIDGGKIVSEPEIYLMNKGFSLSEDLEEYSDSDYLSVVLNSDGFSMKKAFSSKSFSKIKKKYGLEY